MNNMNTKESIQLVALELFSKRGYAAVSIRDICKQVGIKESTIYYHYLNKQDILDSILGLITELIDTMKLQFNNAFLRIEGTIDENVFCAVAVHFLDSYLLNPYVYKVICMLRIEKLTDSKADVLYQKLIFEEPLRQQEKIFEMMMVKGYIKNNNPSVLAYWYYSLIYFSFEKNYLGYELNSEIHKKTCDEINKNISLFWRQIA